MIDDEDLALQKVISESLKQVDVVANQDAQIVDISHLEEEKVPQLPAKQKVQFSESIEVKQAAERDKRSHRQVLLD